MSDWQQRREASQAAAASLDASMPGREYKKLFKRYGPKLFSDDPWEAYLAREILEAQQNRDLERLTRAKNAELRCLEWLPDRRVRVDWPVPVPLTGMELLILSYRKTNVLFLDEHDRCFGFEVHDRDYFAFCQERSRR